MTQLLNSVTIDYASQAIYELHKKCLSKHETVYSYNDKNLSISIDCTDLNGIASMCALTAMFHKDYIELCTAHTLYQIKDNG